MGNGIWCDTPCYNEACNWDGGDCTRKPGGLDGLFADKDPNDWSGDWKETHSLYRCSWWALCAAVMVGDGFCDTACQQEEYCEFDKEDCVDPATGEPKV